MPRKAIGLIVGLIVLTIAVNTASASDCAASEERSPAPVLVQEDARTPHMVLILRQLGSKGLQNEAVGMVVVLEDGPCCGQAAGEEASTPGPTGTVVLLGRDGGRQAIEVEGELLKKVKALIKPAATRAEDGNNR